MKIKCEHCNAEIEAESCRILHHTSGARAVCPRCYDDLRPGADHSRAVPGKLYPPSAIRHPPSAIRNLQRFTLSDVLKNLSARELAAVRHAVDVDNGRRGGAAGTGAAKRRGGRTKAARRRHYRALARLAHQARAENKLTREEKRKSRKAAKSETHHPGAA